MGFPDLLGEEPDRALQFELSFFMISGCELYACYHLMPDEAFLITPEVEQIYEYNIIPLKIFHLFLSVEFGSTLSLWDIQSFVSGHPCSVGHRLPLVEWTSS